MISEREEHEVNVRDRVATIAIDRPAQYNALNRKLGIELRSTIDALQERDDVGAIVITGRGEAFCAGQDLSDPDTLSETGNRLASALAEIYNPFILALFSSPKPVVAAVNGVAAGAGFSIACACDLRVVSERASFLTAFTKIGLVPDLGLSLTLPRIIGYAKALELSLLSDRIDAETANRLGLCTKVVEHDRVVAEAEDLARRLAYGAGLALGLAKMELIRHGLHDIQAVLAYELQQQVRAAASPNFTEGVTAFREKRKARFVAE